MFVVHFHGGPWNIAHCTQVGWEASHFVCAFHAMHGSSPQTKLVIHMITCWSLWLLDVLEYSFTFDARTTCMSPKQIEIFCFKDCFTLELEIYCSTSRVMEKLMDYKRNFHIVPLGLDKIIIGSL